MALIDRQKEWAKYFMAGFPDLDLRAWSLAGACAVVGNYTQENLCNAVTAGPHDHGSDGGGQWRDSPGAPRLTGDGVAGQKWGMQPWCIKHFGDWRSIQAQAAFTMYEVARDYPALDVELRTNLDGVKPENVRKALDYKTQLFQNEFERPNKALAGLANRQNHAASVYMIMSGEKAPAVSSKPTVPPIVTGGVLTGTGAAAAGGAVIAANNGATDIFSLVLFGIAMVLAIVGFCLTRLKKAPAVSTTKIVEKQSPLERLTAALAQRVIANAEVAEAADALRDSVLDSRNLLEAAGEDIITIEHQPAANAVIMLGTPTIKTT